MDEYRYTVAMYIETVPNRSSPPAILLREPTRVGMQVRKRTPANLTGSPARTAPALGLDHTFRNRGRPRKEKQ